MRNTEWLVKIDLIEGILSMALPSHLVCESPAAVNLEDISVRICRLAQEEVVLWQAEVLAELMGAPCD